MRFDESTEGRVIKMHCPSDLCYFNSKLENNSVRGTEFRALVQLVAKKKTGNENFPNVNLVLCICQLIVWLTISVK
jgi:hypothetical protein